MSFVNPEYSKRIRKLITFLWLIIPVLSGIIVQYQTKSDTLSATLPLLIVAVITSGLGIYIFHLFKENRMGTWTYSVLSAILSGSFSALVILAISLPIISTDALGVLLRFYVAEIHNENLLFALFGTTLGVFVFTPIVGLQFMTRFFLRRINPINDSQTFRRFRQANI